MYAAAVSLFTLSIAAAERSSMQHAMEAELRGTSISAVWLDVPSGKIEGSFGDVRAEAAPGSTVKPFVLRAALASHVISERTTFACSGQTIIAGHNLACSHSRAVTVLDARQALANSCNAYFAAVAQRLSSLTLRNALTSEGFRVQVPPQTPDAKVMLALGLQDASISPAALARAYRELASGLHAEPPLRDGLLDSVNTGMAHAAFTQGVILAGKTGSAHDRTPAGQHGWFAGVVFSANMQAPTHVLVVYVPGGNGNDAAAHAHALLAKVP